MEYKYNTIEEALEELRAEIEKIKVPFVTTCD